MSDRWVHGERNSFSKFNIKSTGHFKVKSFTFILSSSSCWTKRVLWKQVPVKQNKNNSKSSQKTHIFIHACFSPNSFNFNKCKQHFLTFFSFFFCQGRGFFTNCRVPCTNTTHVNFTTGRLAQQTGNHVESTTILSALLVGSYLQIHVHQAFQTLHNTHTVCTQLHCLFLLLSKSCKPITEDLIAQVGSIT